MEALMPYDGRYEDGDVSDAEMESRLIKQDLDAIKYGWANAIHVALEHIRQADLETN
jgi:hypothetical protein